MRKQVPRTRLSNDLEAYASAAKRQDYLSREEERLLILAAAAGDEKAQQRLVVTHMRSVLKIATSGIGKGLPLDELVSVGSLGLVKASKRYDPSQSVRFVTFAVYWVRAEINEYVMRSRGAIRADTTRANKTFILKSGEARRRLERKGLVGHEIDSELARLFGMSMEAVANVKSAISSPASLDMPLGTMFGEDDGESLANLIPSPDDNPEDVLIAEDEKQNASSLISRAMKELNEREQDILRSRRLLDEPVTLDELAGKYSISRERIRQIEVRAFEKLQKVIAA